MEPITCSQMASFALEFKDLRIWPHTTYMLELISTHKIVNCSDNAMKQAVSKWQDSKQLPSELAYI